MLESADVSGQVLGVAEGFEGVVHGGHGVLNFGEGAGDGGVGGRVVLVAQGGELGEESVVAQGGQDTDLVADLGALRGGHTPR
ncbi:Uncharacterised protein [Mycobacteroides abscessus subsp. abscessus]|nr:Uncharacterised protein [Mycobacteroides abscessus subsp. abscessus]